MIPQGHITGDAGYDARVCGRFTLTVSARVLAELFDLDELSDFTPRYNIAPTQQVPAIRATDDAGREAFDPRWGLIPSWAKDRKMASRMINARSETVASKPAFRAAVRSRRCLIPADGFYEWRKIEAAKQPYLIRFADRRAFGFAGLWERWHEPGGGPVDSCTIITTTPNPLVEQVHDRMPVILDPADYEEWLQPEQLSADRLSDLLVPCPDEGMEAVPVSTRVNNPRNDDPACLEPVVL
jgi:putative SOS response-associated peptidase YedK